jgi:hypothetical protein
MKKTIKLICIIALITIIGFTFVACDNGNGGGQIPCYCEETPCICVVEKGNFRFEYFAFLNSYKVISWLGNNENVIIPESINGKPVYSIGSLAFSGSTNLENITIPATIMFIDYYAFNDCTNLESVTFTSDSQLQFIGGRAFSGCTNLKNITIPESVMNIDNWAFAGWTASQTITIPFHTWKDVTWSWLWSNGSNAIIKNPDGIQLWPPEL